MIALFCFVAALVYALYGVALGCYWSLCNELNDALCEALQEVR